MATLSFFKLLVPYMTVGFFRCKMPVFLVVSKFIIFGSRVKTPLRNFEKVSWSGLYSILAMLSNALVFELVRLFTFISWFVSFIQVEFIVSAFMDRDCSRLLLVTITHSVTPLFGLKPITKGIYSPDSFLH